MIDVKTIPITISFDDQVMTIPRETKGFTPQELARLYERVQYRPHHYIDVVGAVGHGMFSYGNQPVTSHTEVLKVKMTAYVPCSVQRDGSYVGISATKTVERDEFSKWSKTQALKWLYENMFLTLEQHDCAEWFQCDGETPFDPHKSDIFRTALPETYKGWSIERCLEERVTELKDKPLILDDDVSAPPLPQIDYSRLVYGQFTGHEPFKPVPEKMQLPEPPEPAEAAPPTEPLHPFARMLFDYFAPKVLDALAKELPTYLHPP